MGYGPTIDANYNYRVILILPKEVRAHECMCDGMMLPGAARVPFPGGLQKLWAQLRGAARMAIPC